MNTVYGPIFPIIGGGEESRLIAIEVRREKLRESSECEEEPSRRVWKRKSRDQRVKIQRERERERERGTQSEWLT
jgi:hypothetical protein